MSQIQFIKPSFEEIKSKIQQELKDKSFEEKIIHSQNGIELMPIYTKDTTPIPIQVFPYVEDRIFFQSLTISNDIESINNEIIVALENGASGLRLDFKDISQSMDWNVLFHNIRFDYIYTQLLNISDNLKKSFNEYLSYQKYEIKENQVLFEESFYVIKDSNFFDDVVFLLQKVESNSLNSPYHISIQLKGDYFWDLCKIRAFKILFESIRQKFDLPTNLILAQSNLGAGSSVKENNLLMLTTQAISGIGAGCEGLILETFNGEDSNFSQRMSRNIFNL